MPIRILARAARSGFCPCPSEGLFANHFANIGKFTALLLHLGFHRPHLVGVLHQALGAGVAADDALPAFFNRHLTPRPPLGAVEPYVDEGALAVHRTPTADGVLARGAAIFERFDEIETTEAARLAFDVRIDRAQSRADGASLARIGMDENFGVR